MRNRLIEFQTGPCSNNVSDIYWEEKTCPRNHIKIAVSPLQLFPSLLCQSFPYFSDFDILGFCSVWSSHCTMLCPLSVVLSQLSGRKKKPGIAIQIQKRAQLVYFLQRLQLYMFEWSQLHSPNLNLISKPGQMNWNVDCGSEPSPVPFAERQ